MRAWVQMQLRVPVLLSRTTDPWRDPSGREHAHAIAEKHSQPSEEMQ